MLLACLHQLRVFRHFSERRSRSEFLRIFSCRLATIDNMTQEQIVVEVA